MTIVHAFNYRVAVLRDGVKSAIRVGRSHKAEGRILTDVSWGHQVEVIFQILSTLALEVPTFRQDIERLRGISPNVQLHCEPWGHVEHCDVNCDCLSVADIREGIRRLLLSTVRSFINTEAHASPTLFT